ncbi:MAG TPA: phytanoyl-CoA dioxygenase family protein [Hyphomicrobiales bacterium]|nr:phytanoyl-CoA dioxygenase family protein [Hyphomicrobiales bacterium]
MKPWRWLLLPLWAAAILTSRKGFGRNPILGSERLNRRGLHVWRMATAHRMADWRRRRLAHRVTPGDAAAFARDGFVARGEFLPAAEFQAVAAEIAALTAPAHEMQEGGAVTRRIALTPAVLKALPATRAMLSAPDWRGLLAYVASFDVEPMVYVQTILAGAAGEDPDPQTALHVDTFHPTMKAWFFLHDVAEASGPLTYVPGSHRLTKRRLAWEKRRSVLASRKGARKGGAFRIGADDLTRLHLPPPHRFAVAGNTLVVADTAGMHARGRSEGPSVRIEIYAHSRRNPFVPLVGLDPWSLPGLRGRKVPLYFWLHDRLAPLGVMREAWRRAGRLAPGAPFAKRS